MARSAGERNDAHNSNCSLGGPKEGACCMVGGPIVRMSSVEHSRKHSGENLREDKMEREKIRKADKTVSEKFPSNWA